MRFWRQGIWKYSAGSVLVEVVFLVAKVVVVQALRGGLVVEAEDT